MKKYISYLLTLALLVPAFVSCTQERDFLSKKQKTHTVHFATSEPATRTGLNIEGNMVKPYWQETDKDNVHFFEINTTTNASAYGTADEINLSDDNRTAHFKAKISYDMTIVVSSENPVDAKGGEEKFTFAAVVAQKPDKDAYTFVIPSEQYPDAETRKDPDAEFLVGYSRKSYAEQYDFESNVVDLYFDRVAALGRLAISGFVGTGEKVKSVKITATGGMTGKATYPGDFTLGDKNKVKFTKVDEPLVLNYGENGVDAPAEGAFYAYFVAAPGEASVTSIEVLTDQYKYTKTVEGGASFTFSDEQLLNIDFALSEEIAEAVTADSNTWYKASVLEAGYDYLIVSGGQALKNNAGATAAVAVTPEDGIISFESATDPTIIWRATAHTENTGDNGQGGIIAGHFTLTNDGMYLLRDSQEITLGDAIPSAKPKYAVWDYDGTYLKQESSDSQTQYCYYNNGWATGYTQNGAAPSSSIKTVEIFTNRPPQSISFTAPGPFEYDLDDPTIDFEEPTLSEHIGDVTYSSSDESIATVDPETGNVTFLKAGVVEIIATAAGDDSHQAATASYMIVVTSSQIPTWYKADELVAGEVYMIVSNANALRLNGTSLAAVANSAFTGDSFQYEADDNLKWTATASSGKFTFKSGSRLLNRSSGNIATSSTSGASWSYDSAQNHIITTGNSGDYYLYYDGSAWKATTTAGSTTTAAVYTLTPQPVSRNLKFSAETVTHDLADGEDVNEPELTGDSLEGVTYASENEQIATVNANTGAVTLTGKRGSVKITASALKTNTYKAESVSYTLTVKNSALGPKTYRKVTATSDLVVGSQYLLVYESTPSVFKPILDGASFKKSTDNVHSVTISSNTITSEELEDNELTIMEGYYLYVQSANRYLYPDAESSTSTRGILYAESTATKALTIAINNGIAEIKQAQHYLVWSTSNDYFSANTDVSGSYSAGICLYKLDDGTTPPTPEKQERNLSFGTDSFNCTLGQSVTFPTLSGVTEGVTYSSSDESVATVNASGVVAAKAAGTTIIKAEAQESDTYLAGSAQYTLTVNPAAGDMVTIQLKKAASLTAGQKYILVSNGFALMKNGDDASVVTFNADERTITVPNSSIDDVKWALEKKTSSISNGNEYVFTNGTYYFGIAMNTNQQTYTYTVEVNDGRTVSNNVTIQDHNINLSSDYIYYSGNSSAYYIFYNTSTNIWDNEKVDKRTGSPAATSKTALYVVDDGSGDDPTPVTTTYYLASSIEAGKSYVIVSNGQALQNNSGSPAAVPVSVSDGTIQLTETSGMLWLAETDGDNTFAFSNGSGNYLRRNSSNTGNIGIGTKSTSVYNNQWRYNSGNKRFYLIHGTDASRLFYLQYSSNAWSILENTEGDTQLFTTEPGSNPGGGDDPGDDPTPTNEKTYTYTSNLTADTYVIAGVESNQNMVYVCLFPDVVNYQTGRYKLDQKAYGSSSTAESITTSDTQIIDAEVELIASGSGWIVKSKKSGKYLMAATADYQVSFTDNQSEAGVYTISTGSGNKSMIAAQNFYFYHSGSASGFTQRDDNSSPTNLRFYKLSDNP